MSIKYPRNGYIMAFDTLRKTMGGKSDLYEFLKMFALRNIKYDVFTFTGAQGTAVDGTDFWLADDSAGTSSANFAITAASGGYMQADTGTDDNGSVSLWSPLIYSGDENCGMEVRLQVDVVTDINFEVGFSDTAPEGSDASTVSDIDTPAATAADLAVIQKDTDQTLKTLAAITDGSGTNQNVAATTFVQSTVLVAGEWMDFRVQCAGNFAAFWADGKLEADHNVVNTQAVGALEGGTLLTAFTYWRTRHATVARFPKLAYWSVWQDVVENA